MEPHHTETFLAQRQDKQLQGISLESVLEKRRLDQALNAKEFAVCAGVSYSTARAGFTLPVFRPFAGSSSGKISSSGAPAKMDLRTLPSHNTTATVSPPLQPCLRVLRKF